MAEFFFDLRTQTDKEWVFIDGSYVRCHQHASGARRGEERAIGLSRGGNTTKIHLCVDAHGNPIDFKITGGEVHDSQVANDLIEVIEQAEYFIADKGYDSQKISLNTLTINENIPFMDLSKNVHAEKAKKFIRTFDYGGLELKELYTKIQ